MPLVNLIKEQRQAVRQREGQLRLVLVAIVGVGAVSFLTAGFFTFESVRHNLRFRELTAKKERLKPTMDELEQTNQVISGLKNKMDTLKSAEEATSRWSGLLAYLGTNTPDGVWLSDMRCSFDPKAGVGVGLSGLSVNQEQVGQFMMRLESSEQLQGVALKYTQEKVGPKNRSTQFEFNASVTGTAPKEAPVENATEGKVSS